MKISNKITVVLVTALVMTVAMVALAYANTVHPPAWNSGTGRYTQVYDMSIGTNWSYTNDYNGKYTLEKCFTGRNGIVQCTSNGLTAYPTYYKICNENKTALSNELAMSGVNVDVIIYKSTVTQGTETCLAIRNDPRCNSNINNYGNWSPDTY